MTEPRQSQSTDDVPGAGPEGPPPDAGSTGYAWDEPGSRRQPGHEQPPGYEDGYERRPPRTGPWDLSPLFVVVDGLRRALPREVQAQFTGALRELLLTLRSLIDWYLERLDGRRREPRVEDIPID